MTTNQGIRRFLATPGKIASVLDWRKGTGAAVLSLHLGSKSIDLAVSSHPSQEDHPIQPLPSIPLEMCIKNNRRNMLQSHIFQELSDIVQQYKVCGMVVSWPLQKEGWCGASCGRVLHTLDQMVEQQEESTTTKILNQQRLVCLWDGHHYGTSCEDEWGRVPLYAGGRKRSLPKDEHRASILQYPEEGMVAADIARDYIRHHWPQFTSSQHTIDDEEDDNNNTILHHHHSNNKNNMYMDSKWLDDASSGRRMLGWEMM